MSVISAAQANHLNCLVRKKIDGRLFLTCNYTPTEVPALGSSAKFYLGIQDLYKFAVDTSCVIGSLEKYLPVDTEQSFIRGFRTQIDDIKTLRSVIDHSQSSYDGFFAREHLRCYDSIIQAALEKPKNKDETAAKVKLRPETESDFELLYASLKNRADRLLEDLESFIERVTTSGEREEITIRWIAATIEWYSKKQDIYLGQLGDVYQAKMADAQKSSRLWDRQRTVSELHGYQLRRKLNRWIENALFADLDSMIQNCDYIIHNYPKQAKIAMDRRDKHLQARREREAQVGENSRDYFFKNLRQQLEDTMNEYSGGLLPQELLLADINRIFDKVPSQDF